MPHPRGFVGVRRTSHRALPTGLSAVRVVSVVLLAAALTGAGCRARFRNRDKAETTPPTDASLASLTEGDTAPVISTPADDGFESTRRQVLESASLLEMTMAEAGALSVPPPEPGSDAGFGQGDPPPSQPVTSEPTTRFSLADVGSPADAPSNPQPVPSSPGTEPQPELPVAVPPVAQTPPEAVTQPPEPVDPEVRKRQLVDELAALLGDLARTGDAPGSAALALAGLETLAPRALDSLKEEGLLSEAEFASLNAAQQLFAALASEGGIADPGEVSGVLDRIRQELDAQAGLRITRSVLCARVSGFGRYEQFAANRFIAGQAQPVIVYTEVDRFGTRRSTGEDGEDRFQVELSQRLELYHTADNLNTWNRAAETDKTTSRNRLRDYYLINQVTLPANLTIGKYHLKVVMRDLVNGHAAEAIIPIEIVAGANPG